MESASGLMATIPAAMIQRHKSSICDALPSFCAAAHTGGDTPPSRAVVQCAGLGFRLNAELLKWQVRAIRSGVGTS